MSVGAVNKQTGERIPTAGMPAIDSVLSGTSTNPVQNRVVKAALDSITDGQNIDSFAEVETALAGKANSSDLGDKSNLTTTDKSSCVGAINEVNGGLTNLVKSNSITLTTSNSGIVNTPIRDTVKVLQVITNGTPCVAFTFNGYWYFGALKWDANTMQVSLKPSTKINFTYYYI